jgi:glycosyltransferase involved in cell wall biosynthesis
VGKSTVVILKPGITVCIPTIPPRAESGILRRAQESVAEAARNVYPGVPVQTVTYCDHERRGAAVTRQRALEMAQTTWVAFLDDDDTMDPWHLKDLYEAAHTFGADYLWSRFRIGLPGGRWRPGPDPLGAGTFEQWNDDQPAQTTVTTMVRTELARDVGGFVQSAKHDWKRARPGHELRDYCDTCG